jgi:spore coat protein CotH
MYDFETALVSENFSSEEDGYQKYIDLDSFIDFFILNEVSKNPDGFRLSTFMHKDKGEKLKMGPIWDFNIAFGNVDYCNGASTEGWAYKFNDICPNDTWLVPFWWERFMEDPIFIKALKERWTSLRTDILSTNKILRDITTLQEYLETNNAIQNNFSKWLVLGKYIWPNAYVGNNYTDEINYLKDWTDNRLEWLDNQINSL